MNNSKNSKSADKSKITHAHNVRLTDSQRKKLISLGGSTWVREQINKVINKELENDAKYIEEAFHLKNSNYVVE